MGDDEAAAVAVLRAIAIGGGLAEALDVPEIIRTEFEFPLPRGRADIVLFHVDGGVTVIEVKAKMDERTILAGIGQVCMYAVQLGYSRSAAYVRKMLAVPIAGRDAEFLDMACALAGVEFVALGEMSEHHAIWREVKARILSRAA